MAAPRAAWKGFLKVGSVSCGVKLVGVVTEAEKIRFNVLNRKTGNRVKSEYVDEGTNEPVSTDDQFKGYEVDKEEYIEIDPEEIKRLKLTSEHTLDVDEFVPMSEIDTRYLEKPYYLLPADRASAEAFNVLRDAMAKKNMAARSCVVMYQHGHEVVIQPYGKGMLLTWLRPYAEMVSEESAFENIKNVKVDKDMIDLAGYLVDKYETKFDPSHFEDRFEEALVELIDAKRKGKKLPTPKAPPKPEKVVNLADVLKKSLAAEGIKAPAKGAKKSKAA